MNAPTQKPPFAQRFPAYMTKQTAAACLKASKVRRAQVLERRATQAGCDRIRGEIEQAVAKRVADVLPFPLRGL